MFREETFAVEPHLPRCAEFKIRLLGAPEKFSPESTENSENGRLHFDSQDNLDPNVSGVHRKQIRKIGIDFTEIRYRRPTLRKTDITRQDFLVISVAKSPSADL